INDRTYHSAGNNSSQVYRHLLIYTYGRKWMRMWDEYRPSPALAARATTAISRQLLGLTDPYGPPAPYPPDPPVPEDEEPAAPPAVAARFPAVAAPSATALGSPAVPAAEAAAKTPAPWTEEGKERFARDGYLVIPGALSPAELAWARAVADEAEARWQADLSLPGTRIPEFVEIEAILEYDPFFSTLAEHPRILPCVREALGTDIGLIDHSYYITPPGGQLDGSSWHTDVRTRLRGVWHAGSTMLVRAMIALTDIGPDGGATLVLPGSHLEPDSTAIPRVATPEEMPGAVQLTCRAGDAYFFNGNVLHAPGTNRGSVTRRVLLFAYGHKWMRMWQGHGPSPELARRAATPMRRQLLGLTPPYRGPEAPLPPAEPTV
ncbi:MAG TPA: phytanoyl-CoA dioxygenase family protein, partial [Thermoanaerobaculia bacterium]